MTRSLLWLNSGNNEDPTSWVLFRIGSEGGVFDPAFKNKIEASGGGGTGGGGGGGGRGGGPAVPHQISRWGPPYVTIRLWTNLTSIIIASYLSVGGSECCCLGKRMDEKKAGSVAWIMVRSEGR